MDLVERNALIEIAKQQGYVDIDDILGVSTVEAAPVVHGKWVQTEYTNYGEVVYKCSACGDEECIDEMKSKSRCPNCAAMMDL